MIVITLLINFNQQFRLRTNEHNIINDNFSAYNRNLLTD